MAVDVEATQTAVPAASVAAPTAVEIPYRRVPLREALVDTWHSRHVLWLFSVFAVKRMFFLTVLGPAWLFIHVAVDIGGKTFLFGSVLGVSTPHGTPYIIFLLAGMLGWTLFQQSLNFGIKSFQRYRRYTERLSVPLLIVPIAAGAQALLQFFIYLSIIGAGLGYYALRGQAYYQSGTQLLLVPFGLMLCLLFSWGLSFLLAPLNYRKRDVRMVIKYAMTFWLYITPVVYPLQHLHGAILIAAKLNPLAPMVEMIKYGLIGGGNTGTEFAAYGTICAVGTFLAGLIFLNRQGPKILATPLFADEDDDDEIDRL